MTNQSEVQFYGASQSNAVSQSVESVQSDSKSKEKHFLEVERLSGWDCQHFIS